MFDERGKFIYLSEEEIQELERKFQEKGKLNRMELVETFSKVVRMEPLPEDLQKLREFESQFDQEIRSQFEALEEKEEKKD